MKILPYTEAGGIAFGWNIDPVILKLGNPPTRRTDRLGRQELDYGGIIIRLDKESQKVVEITLDQEELELVSRKILFTELAAYVSECDPSAFESHGFLVSPRFGLAFDSHDRSFLTLFAESELEKWEP